MCSEIHQWLHRLDPNTGAYIVGVVARLQDHRGQGASNLAKSGSFFTTYAQIFANLAVGPSQYRPQKIRRDEKRSRKILRQELKNYAD